MKRDHVQDSLSQIQSHFLQYQKEILQKNRFGHLQKWSLGRGPLAKVWHEALKRRFLSHNNVNILVLAG